MLCARSAIGFGPTSSVRRANTVLSERRVACLSGIRPAYVWSKVWTCQLFGPWKGAERYWAVLGLLVRCRDCVRTHMFNLAPPCRRPAAELSKQLRLPLWAMAGAGAGPVAGLSDARRVAGSGLP